MKRLRNLLLILLEFGILRATSGFNSTLFCKTLSPGRDSILNNETLLKCYIPLETETSCEIGKQDPNDYPRCVQHAKCIQNLQPKNEESPKGICVCEKDFKATSYFTCDPIRSESESCQFWTGERDDNVFGNPFINADDCDTAMGLRCSDGICQCQEDTVNGVCLLPHDHLCRVNQTGFKSTARCYQNTHCAKHSNDTDVGICTCDEGYSEDGGVCEKFLGFGEPCDEYSRDSCDRSAGLRCRSGTCSCDLPNPFLEETCTIRIGERCKAGITKATCVRNAACVDGSCKCNEGYLEHDSREPCKLLLQHGQTCEDNNTMRMTMCDPISGLTCIKRRCDCRRGLSSDKKSCILHIRDKCYLKEAKAICPANSSCKRQRYSHSNSTVGTCECVDGFSLSEVDGECHQILGKGETCKDKEDFCNRKLGLSCKFSVCACANGETDVGRCKLKVGDPCTSSGQHTSICAPNSKCEGNGEDLTCKCERGLISTNDKSRCVPQKGYLETCGETEGICANYLPCVGGRCQCSDPDNFLFDPEAKECRSKGVCQRDSDCQTKSTCQPLRAGSSTKWCNCKEGYSLDHQSLCKSNYMTSCSLSIDCLTAKSMGCIDGVCRCIAPWNQIYNSKIEECVGLVGSPCGNQNKKCMENAFCDTDGICGCASGAITTEDGKCAKFLHFGAKCTQKGAGYCNWAKGLACVDGVCACVDPYLEYLADQGTCVGKPGSICGLKIPVGKCEEEKTKILGFSPCNYYDIHCGGQTVCKKTDIGDINRCLT